MGKPGIYEGGNHTKIMKIHNYVHVNELKKTGTLQKPRMLNIPTMWHFYHGDALIFHEFFPDSGEYRRTELGFHTNQFFVLRRPNVWSAFDFVKHQDETFVLVGLTIINVSNVTSTLKYPTREYMLSKFPIKEKTINYLFGRESTLIPLSTED